MSNIKRYQLYNPDGNDEVGLSDIEDKDPMTYLAEGNIFILESDHLSDKKALEDRIKTVENYYKSHKKEWFDLSMELETKIADQSTLITDMMEWMEDASHQQSGCLLGSIDKDDSCICKLDDLIQRAKDSKG